MKKILVIFIVIFSMLSCTKEEKLLIVHVNDLHGKIENFPKLAHYVDSLRKVEENVFVFSAGDLFSGNPFVDMHEKKGYPIIDLMNQVGFDVTCVGNHEFDYGQATTNERIAEANFKFVNSNILPQKGATLKKLDDYTILMTKAGTPINVVGVVQRTKDGGMSTHPKNTKGLVIDFPLKTVQKVVQKNNLQSPLILLSHCGFNEDERIAKATDVFDVIIGGHSHTKLKHGKVVNNTLICQASAHMKYFGLLELKLKSGKVVSRINKLVKFASIKTKSPKLLASVNKYKNNPKLKASLTSLNQALKSKDALGSLMCDAVIADNKVDMAFQNKGGIRTTFEPGEITIADIYKLDPFGNYIHIYDMSLIHIKELIANTYKKGQKEADLKSGGVKYSIITDANGKLQSVQIYDLNGKKLKNKNYKVAINSYVGSKYKFKHNKFVMENPKTTALSLIDYIKKTKSIDQYSKLRRTEIKVK